MTTKPEASESRAPEAEQPETEDSTAETSAEAEPAAELQQRVQELEAHLGQARDEMLRAMADLQNYRRRVEHEKRHLREAGIAALAEKLLPVIDNFSRTLAAIDAGASLESVVDGVRLIEKQLRSALEKHGLHPIEAMGKPFDHHLHDAVATVESDRPAGTIIEEVEKGYMLGNKVLRHTKAVVSKGPSE